MSIFLKWEDAEGHRSAGTVFLDGEREIADRDLAGALDADWSEGSSQSKCSPLRSVRVLHSFPQLPSLFPPQRTYITHADAYAYPIHP